MRRRTRPPTSRVQSGLGILTSLVVGAANTSPSRVDAQLEVRPRSAAFWTVAGTVIVTAGALDERARTGALGYRSGALGSLADAGNTLGTGRTIITGLAVGYLGARLLHRRDVADRVLRIA